MYDLLDDLPYFLCFLFFVSLFKKNSTFYELFSHLYSTPSIESLILAILFLTFISSVLFYDCYIIMIPCYIEAIFS